MVAPITGPFTRSTVLRQIQFGIYNSVVFEKHSEWYRQRKPYNLPLYYSMDCLSLDYYFEPFPPNARSTISCSPYRSGLTADSINRAYGKLVEDIGDASLWAVNVAEYKQAIKLIGDDAFKLIRFVRALHRFDFPEAARVLKTFIPKGLKPKAKEFGNNFLKFHFGWEPLVKDIGAAISTLQSPINSKQVTGKSGKVNRIEDTGKIGSPWSRQVDVITTYTRMSCTVTVTNPNLYLASQLGFVNPLAVAWELVPFSFVVDWFVNVGQFLGSMTDFAGLSISSGYTTHYQVIKRTESWQTGLVARYSSTFVRRGYGISGPTLKARPWKGVSPVRAATAISLLVQQLK